MKTAQASVALRPGSALRHTRALCDLARPVHDRIDVLIIIGGKREDNARYFDQIEIVGQTRSPWTMPYERNLDVSIARRPKIDIRDLWPQLKEFV